MSGRGQHPLQLVPSREKRSQEKQTKNDGKDTGSKKEGNFKKEGGTKKDLRGKGAVRRKGVERKMTSGQDKLKIRQ